MKTFVTFAIAAKTQYPSTVILDETTQANLRSFMPECGGTSTCAGLFTPQARMPTSFISTLGHRGRAEIRRGRGPYELHLDDRSLGGEREGNFGQNIVDSSVVATQ